MAKKKRRHKPVYFKATDDLEKEGREQCFILYGSCAIALYRYWDKRKDTITRLFDITTKVWNECAGTVEKSMIQMCEAETGIEVQNLNGKSWRELSYLNYALDNKHMTPAQCAYMRIRQKDWLAPQIMACLMIALHRKYGFGFERCGRVYAQITQIREEFGEDGERVREACRQLTGIDVADATTKQGESA